MTPPVGATARVRVPATSANLGPGFDSLGLALGLHDELEAEVIDRGLEVEVTGEGADTVPLDGTHLVVTSLRRGLAEHGVDAPGLRLRCRNAIPHARGLGSSSAAIVGGLALGRALAATTEVTPLADTDLVAVATEIEGHPDNVAPAVLGGFVIAGDSFTERLDVHPDIRAVALVPEQGLETERARGLLPDSVPHADAAANAGRTALLVAALTGRPDLLVPGTQDLLHQDYREPAMPQTLEVVRALRDRGLAAFVSGAGPTVLVLHATSAPPEISAPAGWRRLDLPIEADGVTVG